MGNAGSPSSPCSVPLSLTAAVPTTCAAEDGSVPAPAATPAPAASLPAPLPPRRAPSPGELAPGFVTGNEAYTLLFDGHGVPQGQAEWVLQASMWPWQRRGPGLRYLAWPPATTPQAQQAQWRGMLCACALLPRQLPGLQTFAYPQCNLLLVQGDWDQALARWRQPS